MLYFLAELGVPAFAATLLAAQLLAREAGGWIGRRFPKREGAEADGSGFVAGGMMALFAFVLALTLSVAWQRAQERRQTGLHEANAIGTAWLRAEAIDHPRARAIARLLEDYLTLRIEHVTADRDAGRLAAIASRTNALQSTMWGHAAAIARERPDLAATQLMAALTEAYDFGAAERLAFDTRVQASLVWLIIGMALASSATIGYHLASRGPRVWVMFSLLVITWTLVIVTILDLGSPRLGWVRADPAPYLWVRDGTSGGLRIPPPP